MSGRPAGGGASVLGGSHRPPSLGAGRSAALTYSEKKQHGTRYCLERKPWQQSLGSLSLPLSADCAQTVTTHRHQLCPAFQLVLHSNRTGTSQQCSEEEMVLVPFSLVWLSDLPKPIHLVVLGARI